MLKFIQKGLYGLWNVWFYVLACFGVIICLPILIVALQRESWYRYVFWLGRNVWSPIILYGMGFWPKFSYYQKLDNNKSYMFVANHLSMIDIMLMLMVVKNPFVFGWKSRATTTSHFLGTSTVGRQCLSIVIAQKVEKVFTPMHNERSI